MMVFGTLQNLPKHVFSGLKKFRLWVHPMTEQLLSLVLSSCPQLVLLVFMILVEGDISGDYLDFKVRIRHSTLMLRLNPSPPHKMITDLVQVLAPSKKCTSDVVMPQGQYMRITVKWDHCFQEYPAFDYTPNTYHLINVNYWHIQLNSLVEQRNQPYAHDTSVAIFENNCNAILEKHWLTAITLR